MTNAASNKLAHLNPKEFINFIIIIIYRYNGTNFPKSTRLHNTLI